MRVIDVHTHMLSQDWLDSILKHGGKYGLIQAIGGAKVISMDGAPFMTLTDGMFDYEMRIREMDKAGVDLAIVSLTCPNVFWGGREISLATARAINDDMARQQERFPERIRWFASLPWQHPDDAVAELARARANGAVGVMQIATVSGAPLTDATFAPTWAAIEAADLPVLVHPGAPPGFKDMGMFDYNLIANIGFMFDTTLAITRMIYDGFFDRHPAIKVIASHGGASLPYLVGRLDQCWNNMPPTRINTSRPPSTYLKQIYYDSVVYTPDALEMCLRVGGIDKVLYGSDYPHNIGDMRGCRERVDALPAAQRDAVRGGNAERIFRL